MGLGTAALQLGTGAATGEYLDNKIERKRLDRLVKKYKAKKQKQENVQESIPYRIVLGGAKRGARVALNALRRGGGSAVKSLASKAKRTASKTAASSTRAATGAASRTRAKISDKLSDKAFRAKLKSGAKRVGGETALATGAGVVGDQLAKASIRGGLKQEPISGAAYMQGLVDKHSENLEKQKQLQKAKKSGQSTGLEPDKDHTIRTTSMTGRTPSSLNIKAKPNSSASAQMALQRSGSVKAVPNVAKSPTLVSKQANAKRQVKASESRLYPHTNLNEVAPLVGALAAGAAMDVAYKGGKKIIQKIAKRGRAIKAARKGKFAASAIKKAPSVV